MRPVLTVNRLFEEQRGKLELEWLAGHRGGERHVKGPDTDEAATSLIGYLNVIRPHRVQVMGTPELSYLVSLRQRAGDQVLEQLFRGAPACIVVADALSVDSNLSAESDRASVPLLRSGLACQNVVEELRHYLTRFYARRTTTHGVFLEVMGVGVLLTGQAGVGKSELALELVSRGHRLIADDAPEFSLVAPDTLVGSCPTALTDFMEVRGLGIVNVRSLFGDSAVMKRRYLRLIVNLEPVAGEAISHTERLEGIRKTRDIMGVHIPEITLPVAVGHNLAVLVECTVRNHILYIKGYDAAKDFEEKQRRLMEQD